MRDAAETRADARAPQGVRELGREFDDYPGGFRALRDAPARVWVRGALPRGPAVAIVGARAATPYGMTLAHRLAGDLARLGFTVVSGLARGIDAAAHHGALDVSGITAAVIPAGLDCITPPYHRQLAERIAERGVLLSEIAAGGPGFRGQFVRRNRLIAAWADATVVVEADVGSGALTTAAVARALGRPVLAVPGDVGRPTSRGGHQLIRAGARICEDVGDVLEALRSPSTTAEALAARPQCTAAPAPMPLAQSAEARLLAALDARPQTADALAARSGLDIGAVLATLSRLEWSGLAAAHPGQRWSRGRS